MAQLNKEYTEFFKKLSSNNSTKWFDEHRKDYERSVKKPFADLVTEVLEKVSGLDPEVRIKASDAIFRINNDIRFSKDKTPYKTYMAANISRFGRKDKAFPGLYFQAGADGVQIFGGTYMPDKDQLQRIREKILDNPAGLEKILKSKDFATKFGTLKGEKNARLPEPFKHAVTSCPYLANKQFYYTAELPAASVTKTDLADVILDYYKTGLPLNRYLAEAFGK